MRIRTLLAAALLCWATLPARADGLKALESFLRESNAARAEFTQVVTSPTRAGEAKPRQRSSNGRFVFQRPDRFRFDYLKPFEQVIVADGRQLWLHDVDLNQVTVRAQKDVLGSTPAAIIAAAPIWPRCAAVSSCAALPRPTACNGSKRCRSSATASCARCGWASRARNSVLDIEDGLGQRSVLRFANWQANPTMRGDEFRFEPPAGADVIRQ